MESEIKAKTIKDRYGREIKNLRISLTRRCNLDCIYCHGEGMPDECKTGVGEEMSPAEIERITGICAGFGVRSVKITGGEPLLRSDIVEIVRRISSIPSIEDVSITTNGTIDADWIKLKSAGLNRVNISFDTMIPEIYRKITGGSLKDHRALISNIKKASSIFSPVKLNMLIMKGINENEVNDIINFLKNDCKNSVLQLIEIIPKNYRMNNTKEILDKFYSRFYYDLSEFEDLFKEKANTVISRKLQNRKKYVFDNFEIEVVRPFHSLFCENCTRIRITADGYFMPCIMRDDNLVNFLKPARCGADDDELRALFLDAVNRRKPFKLSV